MWRAITGRLAAMGGVRVKLDIRSGLHQGVEYRLEPGAYTFGGSNNCDFVLEDRHFQPLAFELKVADRSVEIIAEQPVGVDDGQETLLLQGGLRSLMTIPSEIHIGEVTIGVGPEDRSSSMIAWIVRNPLVTGIAVLAVVLVGVFVTAQATTGSITPSPAEEQHMIESVLRENGLDQSLTFSRDDNRWVISGEVNERRDTEKLAAAIRETGVAVDLDVTDKRSVLRSVDMVLAAFPGRLKAAWTNSGSIKISGHVPTESERNSLENALRNDVRGVDRLELAIETHSDIRRAVTLRVDETELASKINLTLSEQTMLVRGQLSPAELDLWREIEIWYDMRYEGILPIRTDFQLPVSLNPNLEIRAIWSGNDPYVIAGNGSKYGPGAILPGGWQIKDILSDRVVLDRNGALIELRM